MRWSLWIVNIFWLSTAAFAQTTEEYQALYGTPGPSDAKVMKRLNQVVKAREDEQAVPTCKMKGKTPEVVGNQNCHCSNSKELFTLTYLKRTIRVCCPSGSKPSVFAAQTRSAKLVCSLQSVDAGVPLSSSDAGTADTAQ